MCMYMYWLLPGLLRNYWADRSADIYWSLEVLCAAHVVVRFHDDLTYRHSDAGYSVGHYGVSGDLYGLVGERS